MSIGRIIRNIVHPHREKKIDAAERAFLEERAKLKDTLKEFGVHHAFKDMEQKLKGIAADGHIPTETPDDELVSNDPVNSEAHDEAKKIGMEK